MCLCKSLPADNKSSPEFRSTRFNVRRYQDLLGQCAGVSLSPAAHFGIFAALGLFVAAEKGWRPMLTIYGGGSRFCDGVSRRNFLKIGALGLGGLALPQLLRAEAQMGIRNSHKAVIMIFLPGGPSHQDIFDLKTDAP